MAIWDYKNDQKKRVLNVSGPITSVKYSGSGKLLVYAVGNDWN